MVPDFFVEEVGELSLDLYFVIGCCLLLMAAAAMRVREGTVFPPSAVFFGAFFVHAFVTVLVRFDSPFFEIASWPTLSWYNVGCFLAALAGYVLFPRSGEGTAEIKEYRTKPGNMFGRTSFWIAVLLVMGLIVIQVGGSAALGLYNQAKGFYGYDVPSGVEMLRTLAFPLYIFVPAVLLAAYNDRYAQSPVYRWVGVLLISLLLLHSLATFSRQLIFAIMVTTFIVVHFRIYRISLRTIVALGGVAVVVTAAALLRRTGEGLLQLGPANVVRFVQSGEFSVGGILYLFGTMVPGQAVFSNVIQLVEESSLHWGGTYVGTLIDKLSLGLLGRGGTSPSRWFIQSIGYGGGSHGFDFSMIAETYMNFGRFGFLFFVPLGCLVAFLSRSVRRTRHPVMLVWSAFMIVNLVIGFRNDSVAFITRALYFVVPLIVFRKTVFAMVRRGP